LLITNCQLKQAKQEENYNTTNGRNQGH